MRYLKKRIVPLWAFIFLWILNGLVLGYTAQEIGLLGALLTSPSYDASWKKPKVHVTITVKPKKTQPIQPAVKQRKYRPTSVGQQKTQLTVKDSWSNRKNAYAQLNEAVGNPPLPPIQHLMNNGYHKALKTIICPPRIIKIRPPAPPPTIIKTESGEIKIDY